MRKLLKGWIGGEEIQTWNANSAFKKLIKDRMKVVTGLKTSDFFKVQKTWPNSNVNGDYGSKGGENTDAGENERQAGKEIRV